MPPCSATVLGKSKVGRETQAGKGIREMAQLLQGALSKYSTKTLEYDRREGR